MVIKQELLLVHLLRIVVHWAYVSIPKKSVRRSKGYRFCDPVFSGGGNSGMMKPFTTQGADLLHLRLSYDSLSDNYFIRTKRIVEGFRDPVDAVLIGSDMYVIEYGGEQGNIWKISLPGKEIASKKTKN